MGRGGGRAGGGGPAIEATLSDLQADIEGILNDPDISAEDRRLMNSVSNIKDTRSIEDRVIIDKFPQPRRADVRRATTAGITTFRKEK